MLTRQEYIKKFTKVVIDSVKGTGLFPSVVMAQAILESSDSYGVPGNNLLAKVYNNHFGVKADKAWKGTKAKMQTREVINGKSVMVDAYFRAYQNPEDSFRDRNAFLVNNPRYAKGGVFKSATPQEQAERLQASGYATDPAYAIKIQSLIRILNLKELDELAKKNIASDLV